MNILNIEHIHKIFGDKVIFDDISCGIDQGEKIGIIGVNGTGKTTLLRVIAGEEEPDEGQVITQNGIRISWLPQTPEFPQHMTILDYVAEGKWQKDWSTESEARRMLNTLGITDQNINMDNLSGGEKKRVALARMLLNPADILILDEPTNHLDGEMVIWLEDFLRNFRGTVIMVTHDRYFLDRIVNRIFSLEGDGKVRQFEGGYSDYLIRKELEGLDTEMSLKGHAAGTEEQPKKAESSSKDTWKQREPKLKFTFKEQREFESIDDDIAKLEEKIETLDAQIAANATNSVKLRELMEKKEETENALDEKMDRWVYLNDLNEKIQDAKQQG